MKIKKLWVSRYKNLENIELTFQSDLITLLVGKNGLGKSNLIEVLALIFQALHESRRQEELEKWASTNFQFEIFYETRHNDLQLTVKDAAKSGADKEEITFAGSSRPTGVDDNYPFAEIEYTDFRKNIVDNLPAHVMGYYSGENKRIAELIAPSEREVIKELKANKVSDDFRFLFFTQSHHSQLLLLTMLAWKGGEHETRFRQLCEKYLNITEVVDLQITFQNPEWNYGEVNKDRKDYENKGVNFLSNNLYTQAKNPFWNCKGKVERLLFYLYNNSEGEPGYEDNWEQLQGRNKKKDYREKLFFNSLRILQNEAALKDYFKHPLELFDALDACLQINILEEITFRIRKKDIPDLISFSELSEGEQQLLTVMSLLLVTGKDDCLFLLDEPDTHLNPEWQRDYVNLLTEFNLNDERSHIFVATHSPLIVQAIHNADILVLKKDGAGKIYNYTPVMTSGHYRVDQVLVSDVFDLKSSRAKELDDFMEQRLAIIRKGKLSKADHLKLDKLKNEMGFLPTGETTEEIENLAIIHQVADLKRKKKL